MPMDAFGSPHPYPITGPPYPQPGPPPPNSRWDPTTGTWQTRASGETTPTTPPEESGWWNDASFEDWYKRTEGPKAKWLPDEWRQDPALTAYMEDKYKEYLEQLDDGNGNGNGNGGGNGEDHGLDPRPFGEVYGEFQATIPPFAYPDFVPPPGAEFSYRAFEAPAHFEYPDFVAPTGEAVFNDPGYAFRRREGERALENRASALGALRTGGTIKDFLNYNQAFASNEYGNVYDRQVRDWTTGYTTKADTYDRNYRNVLDDYLLGYNRALGESDRSFNQALQSWQTNFGNAATSRGFDLDLAGLVMTGRGQEQGGAQAYLNSLLALYELSRPRLPAPAGAPPTYTPQLPAPAGAPPTYTPRLGWPSGSDTPARVPGVPGGTAAPVAPGAQAPALQAPRGGGAMTKSVYRDPFAQYYPV